MKKLFLLLTLPYLMQLPVLAQEAEEVYDPFEGKYMIGFSPQYLLQQAIRFNVDIPSRKNHLRYLSLAPYLYAGYSSQYEETRQAVPQGISDSEGSEKDKVRGIGLEVMRKHYFRRDNERDSPIYMSYGLGYHYIELGFSDLGMISFEEDGLTLYRFAFAEQQETIHRLDVIFLIGATTIDSEVLFFDLFLGPVLKNSFIDASLAETRDHNMMLRHGYDGLTLRVGFTLGVILK